jgi:hypothetical protein
MASPCRLAGGLQKPVIQHKAQIRLARTMVCQRDATLRLHHLRHQGLHQL